MRNAGVLILFAIGAVVLWMLARQKPRTVVTLGPHGGDVVYNDTAVSLNLDTGSNWYDYWRSVLNNAYIAAGVMPPEGPSGPCQVVSGITKDITICSGTPIPQSP
jgi:hypothetical protein